MGRITITFKGPYYDVMISGDNANEIKREFEKIRKTLDTKPPSSSKRKQPKVEGAELRGLLNQRTMELVNDGFFKTEKTIGEVVSELKNRGYPYSRPAVGMALLTFVRKKILRRIVEAKEGKEQYFYINP